MTQPKREVRNVTIRTAAGTIVDTYSANGDDEDVAADIQAAWACGLLVDVRPLLPWESWPESPSY